MYPPAVPYADVLRERAASDPEYRRILFCTALKHLLKGDVETARILLRDYMNTTTSLDLGRS